VQDAYDQLRAAVIDPNPVLYFEHKALYRNLKGSLERSSPRRPLGQAEVVREGNALTVVTYGGALPVCLSIANEYEAAGRFLEVVDLRCIAPLDLQTVTRSVTKTGRLVVVHEDTVTAGIGAEVAAACAETIFWELDAPILRVGALDSPVPFAKPLEDAYLPYGRIRQAIDQCLSA
jgi:2-oxoisovalerate dehydrogenase E1 component